MSSDEQIIKAYSKLKLNPSDYSKLQKIEKAKKDFNYFFNRVHNEKILFPKVEEIKNNREYLELVF